MSTFFRTNASDLYLSTALPFLEHVVEESHDMFPKVYEKVFNVRDMKNGFAQHTQISSLAAAAAVAEGAEIAQDRIYQGYSTNFQALKYGLLLATTQEAIDDEKYDSISKNPAKMGRAMASAEEIVAANLFNNAFTTTGSDGKVLCATDHPLLAPGAGTSSNTLSSAADLSVTSLKDLITVMRGTKDTAGNKVMIKPKWLLVPAALEFTAYELLRSTYLPDSPNNNISSVGPEGAYKIEPLTWDFLTDSDAFFLAADAVDHEMYFYWSKRPEVKSQMEFKSDIALTRCLARFVAGYSDWRGVAGSPGV